MGITNKTNTIKRKETKTGKNAPVGASVDVAKDKTQSAPVSANGKKTRVSRGDKKRPVTKEKFLEMLLHRNVLGNVTFACRKLRIDRTIVYDWRKKDEEFAKKWDDAQELANDLLSDEAENALLSGIRGGNATLIIFTLKNRRPAKWKDRLEHGGEGGGPIEHQFSVTPEFALAMQKMMQKENGKPTNSTTGKSKPSRS